MSDGWSYLIATDAECLEVVPDDASQITLEQP
jgi:hypothetical protein